MFLNISQFAAATTVLATTSGVFRKTTWEYGIIHGNLDLGKSDFSAAVFFLGIFESGKEGGEEKRREKAAQMSLGRNDILGPLNNSKGEEEEKEDGPFSKGMGKRERERQ